MSQEQDHITKAADKKALAVLFGYGPPIKGVLRRLDETSLLKSIFRTVTIPQSLPHRRLSLTEVDKQFYCVATFLQIFNILKEHSQ
ncbi:hypothetical protein DPV78_000650 [Talaromyces pinophilus]|nr:hypothetical protein DPV78_000650 [Talaromyces pinophilus]